jgi:hypothetical protein
MVRHARLYAGHPRLRAKKDVDGRDKPGHDGAYAIALPLGEREQTEFASPPCFNLVKVSLTG